MPVHVHYGDIIMEQSTKMLVGDFTADRLIEYRIHCVHFLKFAENIISVQHPNHPNVVTVQFT